MDNTSSEMQQDREEAPNDPGTSGASLGITLTSDLSTIKLEDIQEVLPSTANDFDADRTDPYTGGSDTIDDDDMGETETSGDDRKGVKEK